MTEKVIKFAHDYYKLNDDEFTTIRGKTYLKRHGLKVGSIVRIKSPNHDFLARIIKVEVKRICDIDIETLRRDGEYPGFEIKTHQDFIDLLNSFIPYKSNRLTSEKAIIYLKRWRCKNGLESRDMGGLLQL